MSILCAGGISNIQLLLCVLYLQVNVAIRANYHDGDLVSGRSSCIASGSCFFSKNHSLDRPVQDKVRSCLKDKKILILGNSVSRHVWFILDEFLSGTAFTRNDLTIEGRMHEKTKCASGPICFTNGSNVKFIWQQEVFSEVMANAISRNGPFDLIIGNMGSYEIFEPKRFHNRKNTWAKQLKKLSNLLSTIPCQTKFVWRTSTRLCPGVGKKTHCGEFCNYFMQESNIIISNELLINSPWVQVIDGYQLTHDCFGYNDHVHHSMLTIEEILMSLVEFCPDIIKPLELACPHMCAFINLRPNIPNPTCAKAKLLLSNRTGPIQL